MDDTIIPLAAEFAPPSRAQWLEIVEKTLKGAPFEKRLVSKTYDGPSLQPLYTADQTMRSVARAIPGDLDRPWDLRSRIAHPDPMVANSDALTDLVGGAASVLLKLDPTGADGIAVASEADLTKALDGVLLDLACVALDAGYLGPQASDWLGSLAKGAPQAPLALHMDPISTLARTGSSPGPIESHMVSAATVGLRLSAIYPKARLMLASGQVVHEAGGGDVEELAFMLASALTYAKALNRAGMPLADAFGKLVLGLAVDGEYFVNIAKIRAARLLFAKLTAACGCETDAVIEARSSDRMLTRYDPWVNLLRLTAAGFSAGVGGAGSVILANFTDAIGLATPFARRQARNMQLVLMEESHLGRVADPAGGAWFLESLTDDLARQAWARFQEIEAAGGLVRALTSGQIADQVAKTRAEREAAIAKRKDGLVGVSEYPNLKETPVEVLHPDRAALAKTGPSMRLPGPDTICTPLAPYSASAAIEALRDRVEALPVRPSVFLATLGTAADYSGRTGFAQNLFAVAGIDSQIGTPDQFAASGSRLAVVCSSDSLYAEGGVAAASLLKNAGVQQLYLAGRPGELEASLKAAGVDDYLFAGTDIIETLSQILAKLGA